MVVVSGSLDAYLAPWCESVGVERICTELEVRSGRLTGRYCRGDCSGPTKTLLIRERYDLTRYSVIYAYGNTEEDREMLELAHRRYYRCERSPTGRKRWLRASSTPIAPSPDVIFINSSDIANVPIGATDSMRGRLFVELDLA